MTTPQSSLSVTAEPNSDRAPRGTIAVLWSKYRNFLLYAVIGVSGVLLDVLTFFLLYNLAHLNPQFANIISTTVGITNNFLWNTFLNFRKRDRLLSRFARFYVVGVVGLGLTAALLWLFATVLGMDANIVKVGSLPVVLVVQYVLNKKWSFR
jgi:putative flippase GtrA